jgi:hypothetical protein
MVYLDNKISRTTENNCANHSPSPQLGDLAEWLFHSKNSYRGMGGFKKIVRYY